MLFALALVSSAASAENFVPLNGETITACQAYNAENPVVNLVEETTASCKPAVTVYSTMASNVPCWRVNPLRAPAEGELAAFGVQIWGNHPALEVARWNTEDCSWEVIGNFTEGSANINGYRDFVDGRTVRDDDILRLVWDTTDRFLKKQVYQLMPTASEVPVLQRPDTEFWRLPDGTFILGRAPRISDQPECWLLASPDWQGSERGYGGRHIGISAMLTNSSAQINAMSWRGETDIVITLEVYNVAHKRWDSLGEVDLSAYRGTPSSNGAYSLFYGYYPLKSGSVVRLGFFNKEGQASIMPLLIATPLE
jgi:hypothetical protein